MVSISLVHQDKVDIWYILAWCIKTRWIYGIYKSGTSRQGGYMVYISLVHQDKVNIWYILAWCIKTR